METDDKRVRLPQATPLPPAAAAASPRPTSPTTSCANSPHTPHLTREVIEGGVRDALRTVYDPEIPVNIYELGLIYEIKIDDEAGKVDIVMTLTTPACPVAGELPPDVEKRVAALDGVDACTVELVWDPPWTKDLLSEEAKLTLGLM